MPPVHLVLSPYPSTNPPTPLPPPSALPRLVKHLPPGYTDSQLYDIFRPFGALASARTHTHFGPDTGMIEFWNEDDARQAEEAMHCADVGGSNIAVQVYQPRRTASGGMSEFNTNAPSFVPSGSMMPYPTQVPLLFLLACNILVFLTCCAVLASPGKSVQFSSSRQSVQVPSTPRRHVPSWSWPASTAGASLRTRFEQSKWFDRPMQLVLQSELSSNSRIKLHLILRRISIPTSTLMACLPISVR